MIDIQSFVYDTAEKAVKTAYPSCSCSSIYLPKPPSFPYCSIVEEDNYVSVDHITSADTEQYSTIMVEVNVYSNKTTGKQAEARAILNALDRAMYGMNFTRLSMTPVPNLADNTIYRLTARYRAETDGHFLYRR